MDPLSLGVFLLLLALVVVVLGSILASVAFGKGDLAGDELLRQLQRRRGGQLRTIAPGRRMLEIPRGDGTLLVGSWLASDVGYQGPQPSFNVRWRAEQTSTLPPFRLVERLPHAGGTTVLGQRASAPDLELAGRPLELFVPEDLAEADEVRIRSALSSYLGLLPADQVPIVEIGHSGQVSSCRYRTAIATVEQAETLINATMDCFERL